MKTHLFTTDEAIINEYLRLYNKSGVSKECLRDIKNLAKQIASEKQTLWGPILDGLQWLLQGDGFEKPIPYNNTKYYLKAYEIFTDIVSKIKDKKSALFVFVEIKKIDALALSRSKDIEDVLPLYDDVINSLKNSTNELIQSSVAIAMLNKSFMLWEINKNDITIDILQRVKKYEDELIDTYSSSESLFIQITVAKCMNNQTHTIEKENELNEKKSNDRGNELIKLFGNTEDDNLKIQVAKAMSNKALSLQKLNAMESVKKSFEMYRNSNNYEQEILDTYTNLINKFKDSNIVEIQKRVALSMSKKGNMLFEKGLQDETLTIYNELIKTFKNNKNDEISMWVSNTLLLKGLLLEIQAQNDIEILNEVKETYTDLIDLFKEYKSTRDWYKELQHTVAQAMEQKANILLQQNELDNADLIFTELIDRYPIYQDDDIRFQALETRARIFVNQANVNKSKEKMLQAIDIRTEILDLYKNDDNIERQQNVAGVLMNRAICKNIIDKKQDAINDFQLIIDTYSTEKYQLYEVFSKIVFDAEIMKSETMYELAFAKNNIEDYRGAIDDLQKIIDTYDTKKYQEYDVFKYFIGNIKNQKESIENYLPIDEIKKFYSTNKDNISALINSISRKNVIPVIGAGLSRFKGADYPLWKEFLKDVFDTHQMRIKDITLEGFQKKSCKERATELRKYLKSGTFENEVKRHFADKNINEDTLKEQPIWLLPTLFNQEVILTTNFDNLIRLVFGLHKNTTFEQCSRTDISKIDHKRNTSTLLYKINGTVEDFKEVILTEEDFENAYQPEKDAYKGMQKVFRHNKDILFLGCSLEERHEILDFCKEQNVSIFTIYPCEKDSVEKVKILDKLSENGVTAPILYPIDDNHSYLNALLKFIAEQLS